MMPPSPIKSAQYQTIPLSNINQQNDDFRITTCEDVDGLAVSIRHAGLITPPLLINHGLDYTIVSGFRRVAACRQLGLNAIIACILETGLSHLDCLRLAVAENALQRPLNLIETSRAFQKLSPFFNHHTQLAEIALTCGLPTNHSIIPKIINLCLLPLPIQRSILKGTISLTMANELAMLEPDTALAFDRLFEQLKLSLNKQKELVTLSREIAHREDISIQQVLAHESLRQIINDENLDRGHKGRQIRSFMRRWRFPRIVAAEQSYEINLKNLKLGHDIRLTPPKEFEGTVFTLNLSFTSIAHLKALQSTVDKMIQHPSFAKIVKDQDSP